MTIRLVFPQPVEPAITQKNISRKNLGMVSASFRYFIFLREINDLHYINKYIFKIKNIYIHIMASSKYILHGLEFNRRSVGKNNQGIPES